MGHIRQRKGTPGYYGSYKASDGRWREVRLPGNKSEARDALRRLENQAWEARHGLTTPAADVEIATLRTAWHATTQSHCRPRTLESYELGLNEVLGWLRRHAIANGRTPPAMATDIRLEDVRLFAASKLQRCSARTTQMRVGALRQMLAWAVAEGLLTANPLARWKALTGPKRRARRALTAWEIATLLAHSPEPFRAIWHILLGTGLRAGELTSLLWDDINLQDGTLTIRAEVSKSKRSRTIPLRQDLQGILRGLRRVAPTAQRHVFLNTRGNPWGHNLSRRLKPILAAAGLPPTIDLHHLRHTFGSHLLAGGTDPKTVQMLMGHASLTTTLEIYCHEIDSARRREAVESIQLPSRPAPVRRPAMGEN